MSDVPIAEYAVLSDCRSAALISRTGSVDWLCFPRFDGPSVFARLLDDRAGHWSLRLDGLVQVSREYLEGTLVLRTSCQTATGTLELTDAMAVGQNERGHELGVDSPGVLLRHATCITGEAEGPCDYPPRPANPVFAPFLLPPNAAATLPGAPDPLLPSSP